MEKIRYEGQGVTRHHNEAYQGLTLMQGWFKEGTQLILVDMDGKALQTWDADFFNIWPNPSHVVPQTSIPTDRYHYHIQGMWILPDASVIFNFANLGTVKMDKCGSVQWTVDRMTHHSVTYNPNGSFWIPANGDVRYVPET